MYREVILPGLRLMEAEAAHHFVLGLLAKAQARPLALRAIRRGLEVRDPRLEVDVFGLRFPNPVGLAAGFDKNVSAPRALAALGFGAVEVGTITPRPQPGKPNPRVFRLTEDDALINRLGFPNVGADEAAARLSTLRKPNFVLGINIGPNATSVENGTELDDYAACFRALHRFADYVAINVSSPNTQGLRQLQAGQALGRLLERLAEVKAAERSIVPVLLKIAPDLSDGDLADIAEAALEHQVDGLIATNTTVQRPEGLRSRNKGEAGGLSGAPLRQRSTEVIRRLFTLTEGKLPIVGVGGIFSPADAVEKLRAGASLVQLYSGLIYQGPAIVRKINLGLLACLDQMGLRTVQDLVGLDTGAHAGA